MHPLNIIVCLKVVPKSEEIMVNTETMAIIRDGVRSEINPPDMNALEMALTLKDRYGGQVALLSMGPASFEYYLRVGLSVGADHAYLLSDPLFAGADTLATTYTLAQGIIKLGGVDVVLCGEESADGATGQVPAGIAEWLNIGQLSMLSNLELDLTRRVGRGRRDIKGGYEIVEVPLPCVVSVQTACNEPRFINFERNPWAFSDARVITWNAADLEANFECIGLRGSPTIVTGLAEADDRNRRHEYIEGTAHEIAQKLAALLENLLEGV